MKTKKSDILLCILFCVFLFGMLAAYLLLPGRDFSEKEKRYLAEKPVISGENILSGQLDEKIESYLADHVPGRDFFVGVNASYDLMSGRQVTKDIYLAENGFLLERPYSYDRSAVEKNMEKINSFAEKIGRPIDFMLVPTAGYFLQDAVYGIRDTYRDDSIIADIYAQAGEKVVCRDLLTAFSQEADAQKLYYRTDHHWTSLGAYKAYSAYMDALGREHPEQVDFAVESHSGFYGSTYSRSGLWWIAPESIELWKNDVAFTVENKETEQPHEGLFYEERLQELDKYTVYLDGNHSVVTIHNPEAVGKGQLLVFRDSYANCLGTFLANSYETVILVDLRYCQDPRNPVSNMVLEGQYDDVLVCYSLGNFLTDENFVWLR